MRKMYAVGGGEGGLRECVCVGEGSVWVGGRVFACVWGWDGGSVSGWGGLCV